MSEKTMDEMMDEVIEETSITTNPALTWRNKAMIIGGVVGAVVGVAGAYMLAQRSKDDTPPEISLGEGVKIGVMVLGLLRSISTL